ncbi:PREDICTED: probable 2-oxoglutarate-dependent dioxygenase At3g49630 isoform X1 [Theobroma cacao]|uniref:Probable 2-oxoglutarate-dependent dioxygenase At3g49630 isoform X1 n=1 Tax=Theobroma cacao TaxID=3641 RepID=A0AB32WW17_THECC|nr:PREDICTED: probable 2-oxoglutarate-dependent dioxygenase At3g49630 isoform X1 [Theobroma cacao]
METQNQNGAEAPIKVSTLNCIDLSNPDIHHSVPLLKQACLDCGFFYVVNHGISQEFMEEVFAQSKNFFHLPLNEKKELLRNEKHRGYTPVLDELLDPDNQVHVGDYKEGYYIGVEVPEDDPDSEKPFYGPNVWPADGVLPGWRQTMEKFHYEALEVAKAIARVIALALDLEVDFFDRPEMLGKPIATLRLLHYEGQISDPSKGIYGAGAHSDYGLITLLATDDVMGLQICKDKDAKPRKWEYVAPIKGAFIINLGDMLERWSNCIFKSTLHRVLGNGQERYSVAYFVEPSHDCLVECLPTCKSEKNPPKFPPIRCGTYLTQRYKDTHAELSVYNKHHT